MAQLCKNCSLAIIERVKKLFIPHPHDSQRLFHPRLQREKEKLDKLHKERSESGLRGAVNRWGREKRDPDSSAIDLPMAKNGSSSSSSSSDQEKERESPLPEIPPMARKTFDHMAEMRGVSKDCADWYWNDCDKANWLDRHGRPITNPEPGLMNVWVSWRSKKPGSPIGKIIALKDQRAAVQRQIETHPGNQEWQGYDPAKSTPQVKAEFKGLKMRLQEIDRQMTAQQIT